MPRAHASPSQDKLDAHEAWVNGGSKVGEVDADTNGNGKDKRKRASSGSPRPGSPKKQRQEDSSNKGDVGYNGPPRMRATSNPMRPKSLMLAINRDRAGSKGEGK
jgi:hypothetical protein